MPTIISVTKAQTATLELTESTIGTVEGLIDPTVSAEVAARVLKMTAQVGQEVKKGQLLAVLDVADFELQKREARAEIGRINALLSNQNKVVERNQQLVQKSFISRNALDDTAAQQLALRQQLEGAQARLATIRHSGDKTRIFRQLTGVWKNGLLLPAILSKWAIHFFR